ncbi:MAG: hypothetical protein Kow0075_05680 [Salibacteraceae bacterium]
MKRSNYPLLIAALLLPCLAGILLATSGPDEKNYMPAYNGFYDQSGKDWNSCVQKASSEWGGRCLNYGFSEGKYTVHLVNTCNENVDLMSCIEHENGRWHCFYRMDMKPNDTLHAYACHGTGKYLKWVRKAGDVTTRFPTRQQVNNQY